MAGGKSTEASSATTFLVVEIQSCKYRLCACTHAAVAACATQVPLITVTELLRKRLKADTLGNMVFWTFFCVLGQPMCLVL